MIITVEGNIGVGKSTLLPKLGEALGYQVLDENVSEDPMFQYHLSKFNEDPTHCYFLQSWLSTKRLNDMMSITPDKNTILERSIISDYIFSESQFKQKYMTDRQFAAYMDFYNAAVIHINNSIQHKTMMIYLKASPESCLERIKNRAREEESNMSLEYLTSLHNIHEKILEDSADVVVDCDDTYPDINDLVNRINTLKE